MPDRISAKIHPIDQMSIAGVYLVKNDPHSSGARYHRVAAIGKENGQSRVYGCTVCANSALVIHL